MSSTEVYKASDLRKDPGLYTRLFESASASFRKAAKRDGPGARNKSGRTKVAVAAAPLLPGPFGKPAQTYDCVVGIDPGHSTGFARHGGRTRAHGYRNLELATLTFWATIDQLLILWLEYGPRLLVVIEDPTQKKVMFARYDKEKEKGPAYYARIAQSVGQNMAHAQLLLEFCRLKGISTDAVSPLGKYDQALFQKITSIAEGSQHARDAARLILDR